MVEMKDNKELSPKEAWKKFFDEKVLHQNEEL